MRFSFGRNWQSYAGSALNEERVRESRQGFADLTSGIELRGKEFLDVGFGQGLALFLAQEAGAHVFGIEVDPACEKALLLTQRFFGSTDLPKVRIASILDDEFVEAQSASGGYDIVHSWGVLHHTGDMAHAFENVARLVRPGGFLIIAIYNRHWTSPLWRLVKLLFNNLPVSIQRLMLTAVCPVMYLRSYSLRSKTPAIAGRGMEFFHDLHDWLGGYPYEYASPLEVERAMAVCGLTKRRIIPTVGWTGCNQFVFSR